MGSVGLWVVYMYHVATELREGEITVVTLRGRRPVTKRNKNLYNVTFTLLMASRRPKRLANTTFCDDLGPSPGCSVIVIGAGWWFKPRRAYCY